MLSNTLKVIKCGEILNVFWEAVSALPLVTQVSLCLLTMRNLSQILALNWLFFIKVQFFWYDDTVLMPDKTSLATTMGRKLIFPNLLIVYSECYDKQNSQSIISTPAEEKAVWESTQLPFNYCFLCFLSISIMMMICCNMFASEIETDLSPSIREVCFRFVLCRIELLELIIKAQLKLP